MTEQEILVANIRANMARIEQLLDKPDILNKTNKICGWYSVNRDNSELRQRMHMLRRDTKALERSIMKG